MLHLKEVAAPCLVLLLLNTSLWAGNYAASFLEIGVGARALGMGGAFCSVEGDGSSFFWNPAGLTFVQRAQLSGMYGSQFGSFKKPMGSYHFVGYAHPLPGDAIFSFNWIRLSINEIPIYTELRGDSYWDRLHNISLRPTGEHEGYLTDTEDAFFFSFGKMNRLNVDLGWEYHRVRVDLPLGINLKYIHQSLGENEASGLGLDIGTMICIHLNEFFEVKKLGILSWGIHLQDLTRTKLSWNTRYRHQDTVPMNVKWGISYRQILFGTESFLCVSFDRDSRWSGRNRWGLEFSGFQIFGLRAGLDQGFFTAGVGFHFWVLQVDYAFLTHELDSLHRVSCSILF